jgi:radical SAM protein with 4Fe4S-binding SPASM domain
LTNKLSKYEQFKANDLKSIVRNDPFVIMEALFKERYTTYKSQWFLANSGTTFACEFPLHIDVDLQDACNQKCKMCHQRNRKRTGSIMPEALLRAIIDEGAEHGLCALNFGASAEPLLQKDLLLWGVDHAAKRGIIDIFVHTNGVLLDEAFSANLLDSGLKHLCVSIDAANEITYQKTRDSLLFSQVVGNTLKFLKLRTDRKQCLPTVRVSFCVNPLNYQEADAFCDYWKDKVDLAELQDYRHVDSSINVDTVFKQTTSKCANPFHRLMVWPDGTVSLCCAYRSADVLLGNLHDGHISQMWQSPRMQQIRKAFKEQQGLPETCRVCMDSMYAPQ